MRLVIPDDAEITSILCSGSLTIISTDNFNPFTFPSLEELDEYKLKISKDAEIQKINVVSKKGFLRNSSVDLIKHQLK